MSRLASLVTRTALAASLVPAAALADEPSDEPSDAGEAPIAAQEGMHLGVGVESTLAGVRGIAVRHGLGPLVGLEVVAMAGSSPGEYMPGLPYVEDATTVGLAARTIVPLRRGERGVIAAVGGIDLGVRSQELIDTAYHLAFEAGLRGELFVVANLSMSLEVGAVLDLPPDTGRVLAPEHAISRPDGGDTTLSLDNTALAAGAGLTFWFR